jgi:hypothetical protein
VVADFGDMKIKVLIPFIFCSCILLAQDDIQSLLDKKFEVIQIEGIDWDKSLRIHNLESLNAFINPLIINFQKASPWRDYDHLEYEFTLGTKVVNSMSMYFNFEDGIILAPKMQMTLIGVQSERLEDFESFYRDLLGRVDELEISDELVILSNSDNEKIVLKR